MISAMSVLGFVAVLAQMSIIELVVILVVAGVGLYLLNTKVPMSPGWKTAINVIVIIIVGLIVLSAFGILGDLHQSVPKL